MRYYFPEKPFFRWFRQKHDCSKLPLLAAVSIGKDAPKPNISTKFAAAAAPKPRPVPIPNARAHAFLDQVSAVHKWLTVSPPPKQRAPAPVASPVASATDKPHKPIDPFDLQEVPATLDVHAFKLDAVLMRHWFATPRHVVQSQAQKDCIDGAPYYPAALVSATVLRHKDLLSVERAKLAYDKIKTQAFLESKTARDALIKILRKTSTGTVDIDATQEFGGDLQKMHRKYAFASITVGQQFPENLNDIRIEELDKSKEASDDLELALGAFRWYAAIDRAHVFYNGRTTRRIQVQSVAIYVMASYGFDDFDQTIEYRGHFNKKHMGLVTAGTWVNYPVYTGKDMHAKNAVLWPVFNQDFRQWRDKHQQGGDMLLFSERVVPRIDPIDVVVPIHEVNPTFKIVGRVAADPVGNIGMPLSDLHLTIIINNTEEGLLGIDGQPTMLEAGTKNFFKIRSNFYRNTMPSNIVVTYELQPPASMAAEEFAKKLTLHAMNFASYTEKYRVPSGVWGAAMNPGEYNSGSYLSGLLHSVMGYVPDIDFSRDLYQAPGWESPMPDSCFKGEGIR